MLLNRIENALVNNPARAAIQRHIEVPRLIEMGGTMEGGHALEIGCGRGVGTALILEKFGAETVDAFDLDPRMVKKARKKLAAYGQHTRVWEGDVTDIDAPDNTYDAVFDFEIIHHVQDWKKALAEINRVLRPRGRLYAIETLDKLLRHPVTRFFLDHPEHDRFTHEGFVHQLRVAGFELNASKELWGCFGWFVADKRPV